MRKYVGTALEFIGLTLVAIALWSVAWQLAVVLVGIVAFAAGMWRD